jgi:hypothetical protein
MSDTNGNGGTYDWKAIVGRYGFAAIVVMILLGIIRYDLILPMVEANKNYSEASLRTASAMETLKDLLKEIRDDQRSGVWKDSHNHTAARP